MKNSTISKLTEKYLKETDENVIGVSYGYNIVGGKMTKERALSFIVKKKLPKDQLSPKNIIPEEITYYGKSFITDVIESNIELLAAAHFCYKNHYTWWLPAPYYIPSALPYAPPTNRTKIRPLKGGVSTTNWESISGYVGTLGFFAIDNNDDTIVGVSNNHVYVDDAFIATERTNPNVITNISGDRNVQPQPYDIPSTDINYIGKVKRYVPISSISTNKVDGALTTIDNGTISTSESWKYEGLTGIVTPLPFATTLEIDNLITNNNFLFSAGRTSGAKGELDTKLIPFSTSTSLSIEYNKQGAKQTVNFTDCIQFFASGETTPTGDFCFFPIAGGDSGSALIANIGGILKIVGLCFAGNVYRLPDVGTSKNNIASYFGFACRIDNVANELNIRAWGGETPKYSSSTVEELVVSGLDNREYIDSGGKRYYQAGLTNSVVT